MRRAEQSKGPGFTYLADILEKVFATPALSAPVIVVLLGASNA